MKLNRKLQRRVVWPQTRVHLVKVTPKIFSVGFKFCGVPVCDRQDVSLPKRSDQGNSEHGHRFNKVVSRISLICLSFAGGAASKSLCPGAIIGVVCYQRRRIVAYSAYIFKALGVTSAWGLCGMHPGPQTLIIFCLEFLRLQLDKVLTPLDLKKAGKQGGGLEERQK